MSFKNKPNDPLYNICLSYSKIKIRLKKLSLINLVREKGLEPSRLAALAPKASVSTNSTTRAYADILSNFRDYC